MKQYLGKYTVHKDGTIVSHYTGNPLSVSEYKKNKQGKDVIYPRVRLCINGKGKWFALHRIIAECFIPNPDCLPDINHKDGNRLNNSVENLEWCSHIQNIRHAQENDLNPKGERHGISVATEEIVRKIRELREAGLKYSEISEIVKLKQRTVQAIGSYQNWKHIE
ncbi:HNH endonuclease [Escherichia phage O18-011]|uniref:HNH homing endonuclease n=1 Tax=Escherichia phage O18-011 TaxID=2742113 RepID=A0A6J4EGY0_9CAUD|nr:HNH endonuclease [Escherichia phage O18-011]BCG45141.1 HNH homing endonuclease [Escherichia phage O18-011]